MEHRENKKKRFVVGDTGSQRDFERKIVKSMPRTWSSLSISRVPNTIRDDFVELAKAEFANDYGAALSALYRSYCEYETLKYHLIDLGSLGERISRLEQDMARLTNVKKESVKSTNLDGSIRGK